MVVQTQCNSNPFDLRKPDLVRQFNPAKPANGRRRGTFGAHRGQFRQFEIVRPEIQGERAGKQPDCPEPWTGQSLRVQLLTVLFMPPSFPYRTRRTIKPALMDSSREIAHELLV